MALVRENEALRHENLFLRRQLGQRALGLLMRELNENRVRARQLLESGAEPTAEARMLARDVPLIPSLAGSFPLDEQQRAELDELAADAAQAARSLDDSRTLAARRTALARLDALELSCTACHLRFSGPPELPQP